MVKLSNLQLEKHRDVTFIWLNDDEGILIACDSCSGVGIKERDFVKVLPEVVGYYTAQVALIEILALKAQPFAIINNLAVEMDKTGKEIIKGIEKALVAADLKDKVVITGSTEENFPTVQTSVGITVLGKVNRRRWTLPKSGKGDFIAVVGIPKVGEEVIMDFGQETMLMGRYKNLLQNPFINEILPIGSKGILYELEVLAHSNNLAFELSERINLDLKKSAGPATCALITFKERNIYEVSKDISLPFNIIARFI